jgi:hypothetical protein
MKKEKFDTTDWNIANENFDAAYAKSLSKSPVRIKAFKKRIINDYNRTKNMPVFLLNLKILAMAEENTAKLAQPNAHKLFSKEFNTLVSMSKHFGIEVEFKIASNF